MSKKDGPFPEKKQFKDTLACAYIISVLSSFNSEYVCYPLDLIKTRMQIQGEKANFLESKLTQAPKRNFIATTVGIVREEKLFALYKGLSSALVRHSIYSGSRLVIYRFMRENVFQIDTSTNQISVWISSVCGVSAGCAAQFLANPADYCKTLLQMEGKRKLTGLEPRVTGLTDAVLKTVRNAGVTTFWKGAVPNMVRAAAVNLGDLSAYDLSKRFLLRDTSLTDGVVVHIISSIIAGFAGAVLGTPPDTIKTRVMNQPLDIEGRPTLYKGGLDCLQKTVHNEGFFALYKGFVPLWIRLAPWAIVFWVSYEQYAKLIGSASF